MVSQTCLIKLKKSAKIIQVLNSLLQNFTTLQRVGNYSSTKSKIFTSWETGVKLVISKARASFLASISISTMGTSTQSPPEQVSLSPSATSTSMRDSLTMVGLRATVKSAASMTSSPSKAPSTRSQNPSLAISSLTTLKTS